MLPFLLFQCFHQREALRPTCEGRPAEDQPEGLGRRAGHGRREGLPAGGRAEVRPGPGRSGSSRAFLTECPARPAGCNVVPPPRAASSGGDRVARRTALQPLLFSCSLPSPSGASPGAGGRGGHSPTPGVEPPAPVGWAGRLERGGTWIPAGGGGGVQRPLADLGPHLSLPPASRFPGTSYLLEAASRTPETVAVRLPRAVTCVSCWHTAWCAASSLDGAGDRHRGQGCRLRRHFAVRPQGDCEAETAVGDPHHVGPTGQAPPRSLVTTRPRLCGSHGDG